jgi:hypothetical protein
VLDWLIGAGVGPAAVSLPVSWTGEWLAGVAQKWFRRLRRSDDLSRLVKAATGSRVDLTREEFDAIRCLLEDRETWDIAGRGTVDDLAARIGSCLSGDSRTSAGARAAALAIARGLLEFAVADMDAKLFQQLLMARLKRMEAGRATALDEALLGIHADLAARLASQGELDELRFAALMAHLQRALDRLPPGAAERGEVVVYLRTLAEWLNTDPWPQDRRFSGHPLTPAVLERELRAAVRDGAGWQVMNADVLASQCERLVVLGRPGSGKTWMARRMARRCAEAALDALAEGQALDEVELPLYLRWSHFLGAGGDFRSAAVSAAFDHVADLGGSRISGGLRLFFAERNGPTLLVIDALDEAAGGQDRLRQADHLPWRIAVTCRESSWNHQLTIDEKEGSHKIGRLMPLRYPRDVIPVIRGWFREQPERGDDLAAQIARRPALQRAASVPLILAFFCILGSTSPLPESRRELYGLVIRRILTGRWRDGDDQPPGLESCLVILRDWAWSGAASHPVSGLGAWPDEIATEPSRYKALDHVAPPQGPPDVDTGRVVRRFIHQSIREHLVAERVAALPVDHAAEALLPHLWYDLDWEYAAPAAIAMHPDREQLLEELARRAGAHGAPVNPTALDGDPEWLRLLARVAAESRESDWSPTTAEVIARAQMSLAASTRADDLGLMAWQGGTSARELRGQIFTVLARHQDESVVTRLVTWVAQLSVTPKDRREARRGLVSVLAGVRNPQVAELLLGGVVQLSPAEEDERHACDSLISLLVAWTGDWDLAAQKKEWKNFVPGDMFALVDCFSHSNKQPIGKVAELVVRALIRLAATANAKRDVRNALLAILNRPVNLSAFIRPIRPWKDQTNQWLDAGVLEGLAKLATGATERIQACELLLEALTRTYEDQIAVTLARAFTLLSPPADKRRLACERLLKLAGRSYSARGSRETKLLVIDSLVRLSETGEDKLRSRRAALSRLAQETDVEAADMLARLVISLEPTGEDQRQARDAVFALAAEQARGRRVAETKKLLYAANHLGITERDREDLRLMVLARLATETDGEAAVELASLIPLLNPDDVDKQQARDALLGLLAKGLSDAGSYHGSVYLAGALARLDADETEKRQAFRAFLALLENPGQAPATHERRPCDLAAMIAQALLELEPISNGKRQALKRLLSVVASAGASDPWGANVLMYYVRALAKTPEDKRHVCSALIDMLNTESNDLAEFIADWITKLPPVAQDSDAARIALLAKLMTCPSNTAPYMTNALAQFHPAPEEKCQARDALLALIAHETESKKARDLMHSLARLDPTLKDLRKVQASVPGLEIQLLAAARRNSALTDWVDYLAIAKSPQPEPDPFW